MLQDDGDNKNRKDKDDQKKKKKKARKKKKLDDEPLTDYEADWKSKIKESKILDDPNLPKDIKEKYAYLENNPLAIIVSNVPNSIQLRGLEEYFNTLITSLNPSVPDRKPVKSLEFGVLKSWIILETTCKEAKLTLAPLD